MIDILRGPEHLVSESADAIRVELPEGITPQDVVAFLEEVRRSVRNRQVINCDGILIL